MTFLKKLVRPNVLSLSPYRCARDDYQSGILLDANENAHGPCLAIPEPRLLATHADGICNSVNLNDPTHIDQLALHRYPDPYQIQLKQQIAAYRQLPSPDYLFTGVGSDEAIDLLMRVFCRPGLDSILICPPTYGMYSVSAQVNDVQVIKVPLTFDFQLNVDSILTSLSGPSVKLVFVCSPGNPTGTALRRSDMLRLLNDPNFQSILVVDEAYVDFVQPTDDFGSMAHFVSQYPNLVVLQTLSKSFGLAGIRMGIAIGQPQLIYYLNAIKPPYNIPTPTAYLATQAFLPSSLDRKHQTVQLLIEERTFLLNELLGRSLIEKLRGGLDANFLLVQVQQPPQNNFKSLNELAVWFYKQLAEDQNENVVVRFRGNEMGCEGCLRVTVGTREENLVLLRKWTELVSSLK